MKHPKLYSRRTLIVKFILILISFTSQMLIAQFKFGSEVFLEKNLELVKGKRIGIVTNHSAVLKNGKHIVDVLFENKEIQIIALFGPEHGIRGDASAGEKVESSVDSITRLKIFSLYGKNFKPTDEMLKDIDVLIYEIQDVGARFYTYISTLFYIVETSAEKNIPIIILDRPNPIGSKIDGPVLDISLKSFVGIAEIPIQHGMTIGELALFFNGIYFNNKADVTIIKMENWNREKYWDDFNLTWIKPSPNIPTIETAIVYPGICLIEATNISEGRGTDKPFLQIGAPFINSKKLIAELKNHNIIGVEFKEVYFTPKNIPGVASSPKYENKFCNGIEIKIIDRNNFEPVKFGFILIQSLIKLFPETEIKQKSIERLGGRKELFTQIKSLKNYNEVFNEWKNQQEIFINRRKPYLLY